MLHTHTPKTALDAILHDLAANGVTDIVSEDIRDWSTSLRPAPLAPQPTAAPFPSSGPINTALPTKEDKAPPPPPAVKLNPDEMLFTYGEAAAPLTILTAAMPNQRGHLPFSESEKALLTNMLKALGYSMEEINVAAIIATDDNGAPLTKTQIEELHPDAQKMLTGLAPQNVLTFGQLAGSVFLTGEASPIKNFRKTQPTHKGCTTVTTYHPRHLLKTPQYKHLAWQDLQPLVRRAS